jgi:hypothetical protein
VVAVLSLVASALHNQFSGLIVIVFGGAVWIGIRQLDYTEFASAGRMFLGGKFRQIIDVEARIADFQSSLSKTATLDDCWDVMRTGSLSFGFPEVRMSLCGKVFEEVPMGLPKPRWQLRIPLANSQYVNFGRDFDSEMNPMVLSAFVQAVQCGLEARNASPAPEVIRMPAVGGRLHPATVTVGSGELKRVAR